MKFTKEQSIQMARNAGFPAISVDNISEIDAQRITRLCSIAADSALEIAAHDAEAIGINGIPVTADDIFADWLRAKKEQQ